MKKLVVFTGAGISAESGLATFRDHDGLWMGHAVEDVATPRAFARNPELVLQFYNERRKNIKDAQPNAAHKALVELERNFEVHIITQNIDDLHERAGSSKVMHLHGEIFKMCSSINKKLIYPIDGDIQWGHKAEDGAQLRPYIVWFEEEVPMMAEAIRETQDADLFAVIGTSLVVYPAASLLQFLSDDVPLYVIDKKVPKVHRAGVRYIEKPATEGVSDFVSELLREGL